MRILRLEKSSGLLAKLAARGMADASRVEPVVRKIVVDVRKNGDAALRRYASKLDGLGKTAALRVSTEELKSAWDATRSEFKQAIRAAAKNIERFARWQMPKSWTRDAGDGIELGQIIRPIESVGCYVPGGRYPLPSTVLMTVVPARVAGVERVVVVSPNPARETLAAAYLLGVGEFYRIGGAQAVAALAYGTESVERVAKIVGPGNIFVTTAKKLVAFDCAIDMLAGPTEAAIVSERGNARFIAADLVAQAEHDPETMVAFFTTSPSLADAVKKQVALLAAKNTIARKALATRGYIFVAQDIAQAMEAANQFASEHLTVDEDLLETVSSAGSVFVGDYSAQSFGDYASGPNHVLPTGGLARVRGGLSVLDYVKIITVQKISRKGLRALAPIAETLAAAEGLVAHGQSVAIRRANA
ncbi:histidinol dehydrogenase [Candidatus Koribacter versatilis Ellin345]|uniref:Histidinol dehydrogenase n=1 Tax=Koribacter versatilis (strain Ellin345) TaxID=204669 RepID=Q1IKB6_KORVE|nr:histidinol dehydrogenase [Candidatus Koribacter versatilis]ABF42684.1 histidinol dehydrogenase [Candidatus Koribacter versatilis Ellin345]